MAQNRVWPISSRTMQRATLVAAVVAMVLAWRERSFTKNRHRFGSPDTPPRH